MLVKGDLQQLVLSADLDRLVGLEGCLSGNVPARALAREGGANGPCGQLARASTVKVVFGPGTFINEAAEQIDEQLAAQTKQAEAQAQAGRAGRRRARRCARGLSGAEARSARRAGGKVSSARFQREPRHARAPVRPHLAARASTTPNFVSTLVFDSSKPAGTPKQRFAYLFPSRERGADLGAAEARALQQAQRTRTIALDPPGRGDAAVAADHGESLRRSPACR